MCVLISHCAWRASYALAPQHVTVIITLYVTKLAWENRAYVHFAHIMSRFLMSYCINGVKFIFDFFIKLFESEMQKIIKFYV